jgi:hypothetical protein
MRNAEEMTFVPHFGYISCTPAGLVSGPESGPSGVVPVFSLRLSSLKRKRVRNNDHATTRRRRKSKLGDLRLNTIPHKLRERVRGQRRFLDCSIRTDDELHPDLSLQIRVDAQLDFIAVSDKVNIRANALPNRLFRESP